jgi:hypothetical protein
MSIKEAQEAYLELKEYDATRSREISEMLGPYIEVTDRYGELICYLTLKIGKIQPRSDLDVAIRDLMADVFDFLYETRPLILKGMTFVAYPMARRAYESLSLLVACHFDENVSRRWISGQQISNAEVRRVLDKNPMGEQENLTKELYSFFSRASHPNRGMVAHRHLGDGNEFVLGAIGVPSLAMLADHALRILQLWFWFGAFLGYIHLDLIKEDPSFSQFYKSNSAKAESVGSWLIAQYNKILAEEKAAYENERIRSR